MQYDPRFREAARVFARASDRAQRYAKGVGLWFAAHAEVNRAAFMLLASWGFEEVGRGANAIADDPADFDYDHTTQPGPRRIRFEDVARFASEDLIAQDALSAAVASDDAQALMAAHLRAFERFQGAARRHDIQASRRLAGEARSHASKASHALIGFSDSVSQMSASLAGVVVPQQMFGTNVRHPRDLPSDVLAILYVSGLSVAALERVLGALGSFTMQTAVLDQAASASREMAAGLESWTPPTAGPG